MKKKNFLCLICVLCLIFGYKVNGGNFFEELGYRWAEKKHESAGKAIQNFKAEYLNRVAPIDEEITNLGTPNNLKKAKLFAKYLDQYVTNLEVINVSDCPDSFQMKYRKFVRVNKDILKLANDYLVPMYEKYGNWLSAGAARLSGELGKAEREFQSKMAPIAKEYESVKKQMTEEASFYGVTLNF